MEKCVCVCGGGYVKVKCAFVIVVLRQVTSSRVMVI